MGNLRIENQSQIPLEGQIKIESKNPSGFGKIIKAAINKTSALGQDADRSAMDLLNGKAAIHETMIASQKAGISLSLLIAVRNKAIEAYKEIMRMPF